MCAMFLHEAEFGPGTSKHPVKGENSSCMEMRLTELPYSMDPGQLGL